MSAAARVSVVIPARDAERYLGEAIDSVLGQTAPAAEIVVIDDGSSDDTAALANSYGPPVTCLPCGRGRGLAAALNEGLDAVTGELLAFLDADDRWLPEKLELQRAALQREPCLHAVFCLVEHFYSPDLSPEIRARFVRPDIAPAYMKSGMLARLESVDSVGQFSTHLRVGEFVDWWARATENGLRHSVVPEVLLQRRIHADNMGTRERDSRGDFARIMADSLRRRGLAGRDRDPG